MSAETTDEYATDMDKVWEDFVPPEGTTAQYLMGQIIMQANPRALHMQIIFDLGVQLGHGSIEAWPETGIDLGTDGKPRADVVFFDPSNLDPAWRDIPASVLLGVAEVVSDSSAVMDYRDKTNAYSRHRIPVYLIVDPRGATWRVLELVDASEGPAYVEKVLGRFGEPIELVLGGTPVRFDTHRWHPYPS